LPVSLTRLADVTDPVSRCYLTRRLPMSRGF